MDIVQYITDNHDHVFYLLAGLCFVVELAVLGLGGPLLFFAMASAITGALVSVGLISGWEIELFVLGVLTAVIAAVLWKPFKRFQNSGGGPDTSSDMIGRQVPASSEITRVDGSIRYSGINWTSRLSKGATVDSIAEGEQCIIDAVDGNVMLVKSL